MPELITGIVSLLSSIVLALLFPKALVAIILIALKESPRHVEVITSKQSFPPAILEPTTDVVYVSTII